VSTEAYAQQVDDAMLYLKGESSRVIDRLIQRMERAAARQEFEQAAIYRDQIQSLKSMQAGQWSPGRGGNLDILALVREGRATCVQVVSFRGGRNIGQRSFFPTQAEGFESPDVLQAFLGQYYRERIPPGELIVSHPLPQIELFEDVFSERADRKVRIQANPRGQRREWLQLTLQNAANALHLKLASGERKAAQFEALQTVLKLDTVPDSIECFDISHFHGGQTVGACVVFDENGPVKSRYRRYTLRGVTPGDDYAAMEQVLSRRYRAAVEGEGAMPDLVLIDGGKGQLQRALQVLEDLGVSDVNVIGVAKGVARKAGFEEWVLPGGASLLPGPESPASHLVQQVRDEAHRFAITGHRGQRQKASVRSELEEIPGVGAGRRRALLTHFGGMKGVRSASAEQLGSVPGISKSLAERIFKALH
jgi:excinuclease ABC subunit C